MGRAWLASFREVSFGLYSSLTRGIRFKALDTGATSGPSLKFSVFYPQPLGCIRMKGGGVPGPLAATEAGTVVEAWL